MSCEPLFPVGHPSQKSKFLDFEDLAVLLGSSTRSLHPQRLRLAEMGRGQIAEELLRLNAAQCETDGETDFYYDPHTKQYTGEARILKGWCGGIMAEINQQKLLPPDGAGTVLQFFLGQKAGIQLADQPPAKTPV